MLYLPNTSIFGPGKTQNLGWYHTYPKRCEGVVLLYVVQCKIVVVREGAAYIIMLLSQLFPLEFGPFHLVQS